VLPSGLRPLRFHTPATKTVASKRCSGSSDAAGVNIRGA